MICLLKLNKKHSLHTHNSKTECVYAYKKKVGPLLMLSRSLKKKKKEEKACISIQDNAKLVKL